MIQRDGRLLLNTRGQIQSKSVDRISRNIGTQYIIIQHLYMVLYIMYGLQYNIHIIMYHTGNIRPENILFACYGIISAFARKYS